MKYMKFCPYMNSFNYTIILQAMFICNIYSVNNSHNGTCAQNGN